MVSAKTVFTLHTQKYLVYLLSHLETVIGLMQYISLKVLWNLMWHPNIGLITLKRFFKLLEPFWRVCGVSFSQKTIFMTFFSFWEYIVLSLNMLNVIFQLLSWFCHLREPWTGSNMTANTHLSYFFLKTMSLFYKQQGYCSRLAKVYWRNRLAWL